jgi:PAS domain S-box-containing protein
MPDNDLKKFYLSIVLPSIMAIALFIISIFVVILPSFERNIMERKKEMISELTNTAWSLLEEYHMEYRNQKFSLKEAQQKAASRIEQIRYGVEYKDYFWIIDMHPKMIMHPYTTELIGADLSDYKDPNGKRLFVEATRVVQQDDQGFIDYMWQWKDDSTRIVPKLSYVKEFEPWGWIVGTGIYLEDVKEEIWVIKKRLFGISVFISLTISIILLFVIRQSLKIEKKRKEAESQLLLSRQKYKSLVEASTEGTMMIVNQKIVFSNAKFSQLVGYKNAEITDLEIEDIFDLDWKGIISTMKNAQKSLSVETKIKDKYGKEKDVIISISQINYASDKGYIVISKEVSAQKRIEKETEHLASELQTSLLLMNQPIKPLINEILKCSTVTPVGAAAKLMTKRRRKILFIHQNQHIIGVVNDSDLKKRVLARELNADQPVMNIMTSPIISISNNALIYEAMLLLNSKKISHLATTDENGKIIGVISLESITGLQHNSVSYLIKEIEVAEDVYQLTKIHRRVPALVNALVESGDKTQNITRIITSVSDAITRRIISLAIEDYGPSPCSFAFMVMGSEGRKEQTLVTDQDNAIIFEETENIEQAKEYFLKLGKRICGHLNEVGYKYCDGGIMAENPKWTQSFCGWKDHFSGWINDSDPQSILEASIFFDFRCVFGNEALVCDLRNHVNILTDNKSVFFYHLAQSITKYKAPVSLFGKIIDKEHTGDQVHLDIKKVLLPITGFIRLYALHHKIEETNSLARIRQLYQKDHITKDMYEELVLSHNYLMQLRFRFQSMSILDGQKPDNIVDVNNLTHIEVSTIKKIFGEIGNLQTKLNFDFKGTM